MFFKFVGRDKEQDFVLRRVVFLQNNTLEEDMSGFYRELMLNEQLQLGNQGPTGRGPVSTLGRLPSGTQLATSPRVFADYAATRSSADSPGVSPSSSGRFDEDLLQEQKEQEWRRWVRTDSPTFFNE
jgi:hypothetical protein